MNGEEWVRGAILIKIKIKNHFIVCKVYGMSLVIASHLIVVMNINL
jgi:hypothetical protein